VGSLTMQGKTCLVTGATSGIGQALALSLARQGATVVLLARDPAAGQATLARLNQAGESAHDLIVADVSSMASVRQAADAFHRHHAQLHLLVNSASAFLFSRKTTIDGLELMFATNHLGPFLLTGLLMDTLKASAPSRILTITAPSTVPLDFDDLQGERGFRAANAFGATKAANLLFTFALARRLKGSGVTANAIHPGLVRSRLMRHAPPPLRWMTSLASAPAERAVQPILRLASDPEFGEASGRFYLRAREVSPPPYTLDESIQDRLWSVSEVLAGLHSSP
jgi:NAD(P)-dependent dehydrogenase (short-subunit alcohol dehydrogenase family)